MKKNRVIVLVTFILGLIMYLLVDTYMGTFIVLSIILYIAMSFMTVKSFAGNIQINFMLRQYSLKNKETEFTVKISSLGKMPIPGVKIIINAKNMLTGENAEIIRELSIIPKGRETINLNFISPNCGCIEMSVKEIVITDPMKIFIKEKSSSETAKCFIVPKIDQIIWPDNEDYVYDMESFRYSYTHSGDDPSETFDIKEYNPGDSCRSIHWKLSAKTQEIMVREPALPINSSLMILDDKTFLSGQDFSAEVISSHTELFLKLSYTALLKGIRHSAGWFNCRTQTFEIFAISTADDVYRMVPALLYAPFYEDYYSSADRYIMSDCEKNYGSYIYVSENLSAINEIEKLKEYGKVKVYGTKNFK